MCLKAVMEEMRDEEDPKELAGKAASILLHCGLHCRSEHPQAEMEGAALGASDDNGIEFLRSTKRCVEGFSDKAPRPLKPALRKHAPQLTASTDKKSKFLKNVGN